MDSDCGSEAEEESSPRSVLFPLLLFPPFLSSLSPHSSLSSSPLSIFALSLSPSPLFNHKQYSFSTITSCKQVLVSDKPLHMATKQREPGKWQCLVTRDSEPEDSHLSWCVWPGTPESGPDVLWRSLLAHGSDNTNFHVFPSSSC